MCWQILSYFLISLIKYPIYSDEQAIFMLYIEYDILNAVMYQLYIYTYYNNKSNINLKKNFIKDLIVEVSIRKQDGKIQIIVIFR